MTRPLPVRAFDLVRQHPLLTGTASLYVAAIAWLTLGPQPVGLVRAGGIFELIAIFQRHTATAWITYLTVEFAANVALFVPVGVLLLLLAGRRWWWLATVSGVLVSASIEIAQSFIPGRVSDVRDLVSNSLGAFVGVLAALLITWPGEVRRRREARQQPRTGEIRIA